MQGHGQRCASTKSHRSLDYGRVFPLNAQMVGAFVSCVGTCNEVRNRCGVRVSS
jgi:hypothetical protein